MIPIGYIAKHVSKKPDWLEAPNVIDLYSVSGCNSEDFADYINYCKHNGYWLFDSADVIQDVALRTRSISQVRRSSTMRRMKGNSTVKAGACFRPIPHFQLIFKFLPVSNSRASTW
jgi:hypothetical protein